VKLCQAAATASLDGPGALVALEEARLTKLEGHRARLAVSPHEQPAEEVGHKRERLEGC